MSIKSIWNVQSLINTKPVLKWCFLVKFGGLGTTVDANSGTGSNFDSLNYLVESVSFGRRETSIVKTYYCGVEANLPGRVMNTGELNIVLNETFNMTVTKKLEKYFNETCCDEKFFTGEAAYTPNIGYNKNDKKIDIYVLTPLQGVVNANECENYAIAHWTFYGCILTSINEEEFSYTNTDDLLKRTVRFSYDYMIRVPTKTESTSSKAAEASMAEDEFPPDINEEDDSSYANDAE